MASKSPHVLPPTMMIEDTRGQLTNNASTYSPRSPTSPCPFNPINSKLGLVGMAPLTNQITDMDSLGSHSKDPRSRPSCPPRRRILQCPRFNRFASDVPDYGMIIDLRGSGPVCPHAHAHAAHTLRGPIYAGIKATKTNKQLGFEKKGCTIKSRCLCITG